MNGSGRGAIEIEPRRLPALRGDLLTVILARPVPPGSRVAIPLAGGASGEPPLAGKVVAVRRNPDGEVEVDLRLHSLSREQRSRLASLVNQPA